MHRSALDFAYRLVEQFYVHIVAHLLHMPVLLSAEHVSRAAYFKVLHGNFEAAAKLAVFGNAAQPLVSRFGKYFAVPVQKISKGETASAPDAAAQLIELTQPQPVRVANDQSIGVGHIYAVFNNRRAYQNVEKPSGKFVNIVFQRHLVHLTVSDGNLDLGH